MVQRSQRDDAQASWSGGGRATRTRHARARGANNVPATAGRHHSRTIRLGSRQSDQRRRRAQAANRFSGGAGDVDRFSGAGCQWSRALSPGFDQGRQDRSQHAKFQSAHRRQERQSVGRRGLECHADTLGQSHSAQGLQYRGVLLPGAGRRCRTADPDSRSELLAVFPEAGRLSARQG
ncbi:hypothetical protein D9M69_499560 [compost metagenome]